MPSVDERLASIKTELSNINDRLKDMRLEFGALSAAVVNLKVNGAVMKSQNKIWKMVALAAGSFATGSILQPLISLITRGG